MNKTSFFKYNFFGFALLNVVSNAIDHTLFTNISKPFLLLLLLGYYVSAAKKANPYIIAALLLSWLGDVLLIFQEIDALFFMGGLGSFLLAHISYTYYFHKLNIANGQTKKLKYIIPVLAYACWILPMLWSGLAGLVVPVILYVVVISTMLCYSFFTNGLAGSKYFVAGAILFALSDSILAFNKFYTQFALAGVLIMLTYCLAQYFIVAGAIRKEA